MLLQISYTSRASRPFGAEALRELVAEAARRNRVRGLTGVLLYDGGTFFQVLEGEEAEVDALLAKLERDARHTALTVLQRRPVARRSFEAWPMALLELSPRERTLPGLSGLLGESRR